MSLLVTIFLLLAGVILVVAIVTSVLIALWKALVTIFEGVFNFLFRSVWGILLLILFFWAMFHFFPHNIHIK